MHHFFIMILATEKKKQYINHINNEEKTYLDKFYLTYIGTFMINYEILFQSLSFAFHSYHLKNTCYIPFAFHLKGAGETYYLSDWHLANKNVPRNTLKIFLYVSKILIYDF